MPPSKGQRAVWTSAKDEILINGLVKAKNQGLGKTGGWPPKTWPPILEELNKAEGRKGPMKTVKMAEDHWQHLKKLQQEVEFVRKFSGFGWDDENKLPTASDEVWDKLEAETKEYDWEGKVKKNKYLRWRTIPFPLYNDIFLIVTGKRATGEGHFVGGVHGDNSQHAATPTPASQFLSQPIDWSPSPQRAMTAADEEEDSSNMSQETIVVHDPMLDLTPSSPAQPLKTPAKRPRSNSDSPGPSERKRGGKRNADATSELTRAMNNIANAMTSDSPIAKKQAICMLNEDGFDEDVLPLVQRLITHDSDVARIYCVTSPAAARIKYAKNMLPN